MTEAVAAHKAAGLPYFVYLRPPTTGGVMASGSARTQGDQVAEYAISHASSLGIKYVIWRQRIYDMRSPGWRMMENRGGNTANHYDHVHISVR